LDFIFPVSTFFKDVLQALIDLEVLIIPVIIPKMEKNFSDLSVYLKEHLKRTAEMLKSQDSGTVKIKFVESFLLFLGWFNVS